ncbi:hypothetical protein GBP346_A1363 [Burkholderia pseudomallei MSHR346]|nr:hypothetical protein GBP346_A1363 [Burkholderia pseudomallei MSHR346]
MNRSARSRCFGWLVPAPHAIGHARFFVFPFPRFPVSPLQ